MGRHYFDANATTPPLPRVVDAVARAVATAALEEGVARRALVKNESEDLAAGV